MVSIILIIFILDFFNKRLDNNNNDVVYAVSQSKIIEMYDKGFDDVNRYYMNRDESNNIIQYNLSDYFEFGTLVYPEEFVALQKIPKQKLV